MSTTREIHYFDYVNAAYEQVRDALQANASGVCRAATKTPAMRDGSMASEVRLRAGGFDVGTDIDVTVLEVETRPASPRAPEATTFTLEWHAAALSWLFPLMHAELMVYPVATTDTQLELVTRYDPPLGVFGTLVDAMIGHRIANACVDRFLADVAGYLRSTLARHTRAARGAAT